MTRVLWTDEARDNLRAARRYIARDNPTAARLTALRLRAAARRLADHPEMGRAGRIVDTRELIVPRTPYIIAYHVRDGVVEILSVIHGAREWPEDL